MPKIQLDSQSIAKLRSISDDIEICDENGEIIGYFRPKLVGRIFRLKDLSPYSDEALQEIFTNKENGESTTSVGDSPGTGGRMTWQVLWMPTATDALQNEWDSTLRRCKAISCRI
jgi:hypothetical protein